MGVTEWETSDAAWRYLSSLERKRALYSRDPYFRESMRDIEEVLGTSAFSVLHRIALLAIKPEALAGRRMDPLLRFIEDNELTPICIVPFAYTRHIVRELWRYQWNAATLEKMDLADRVNLALPTAVLLLRDDLEPRALPAAVRLKTLKGAAAPEQRHSGSIRAALAAPSRMITFVHSADEPADVVRELGIFFDRDRRREILSTVANGLSGDVTDSCRRQLERLEREAPTTDFDADAAWRRILARAAGAPGDSIARQHDLFQRSGTVEWWRFLSLAREAGADEWDVIAICAAVVEHEDAGQVPLIAFDRAGVDGWLSGAARLCTS